ncbi:hypothetical protein CGZ77_05970 [Neisseria sp. KEM232]|nr:hypothetical protein CGZ77_05970 [Neisseria sp. KEM232]
MRPSENKAKTNRNKTAVKKYLPHLGTLACAALAAVFFTQKMSGFMLFAFLPPLLIVRAAAWWKARKSPQAKRLENFRIFVWSVAAAFAVAANVQYVRAARSDMTAIAQAVERYRAANGRLPNTLDDAGIYVKNSFEVRYNYWQDTKKHSLLYKDPLLPFEYYQYDFDNRRWLHDNGEPVTD